MAKIRVLVFASLSDHLGSAPRQMELADPATVSDLRRELAQIAPAADAALHSCQVAVNRTFATGEDQILKDGDEVAMIPPVSGG